MSSKKVTSDIQLLKSYVWNNGRCFLISTKERSDRKAPDYRFNKTTVWRYDWKKRCKIGDPIYNTDSSLDSIRRHFEICEVYFETGNSPIGWERRIKI